MILIAGTEHTTFRPDVANGVSPGLTYHQTKQHGTSCSEIAGNSYVSIVINTYHHSDKYARASVHNLSCGFKQTPTCHDQDDLEQRESVRLVRLPRGSHDHDPLRLRFVDIQRRPRVSELERVLPSTRPKCRWSVARSHRFVECSAF
jgi:hypothetical protein